MPRVDVVVETPVSTSARVRQLEGMFDVPMQKVSRLTWSGDMPIEAENWNVGLIVGPSGSGKSTIARSVFGNHVPLDWSAPSVIDAFDASLSMERIAEVCQSVGFNTIPAWMRPFSVLSNGEQFRVDLARRLLELPDPVVVDEFTSVVDRQVAMTGSHAVQKYIRAHNRKFIAVTCHYDVIDWLQPDWIFEPGTMTFRRRCLQRRPELECSIARVDYSAWKLFAPYHYLTNELHRSAACYVLFVGDRPAAFAGMLYRPHPKVKDILGCSRLVTLPDWQGLGLAMALIDSIGAAYKAIGMRVHTYPAHPALIRSFGKSRAWRLEKKPGMFSSVSRKTSTLGGKIGGRPCAVFSYAGQKMESMSDARALIG